MTSNSTTVVTEESLYSVDFLRVVVHVTHNQHKLNNGVRVDINRIDGGYDTERANGVLSTYVDMQDRKLQ